MATLPWRVDRQQRYGRGMEATETSVDPMDLSAWAGRWVAVKDGVIIAHAETSQELVPLLRKMGEAARGAVAHYVERANDRDQSQAALA